MKKKAIFFALFVFLMAEVALAASEGGEHHGSIYDLVAPTVNFLILFSGLFFVLRKKLSTYFVKKSEAVAQSIEHADHKFKEAQLRLNSYEKKLQNLESEILVIKQNAEKDEKAFTLHYIDECKRRVEKIRSDSKARVEAEKSSLLRQLNAELIDSIITNAKSIIDRNKEYQSKISKKLLEGIRS